MEPIVKHTFVIMAYKAAPFLETTIQSVLTQDCQSHVIMATSTPSERIQKLAEQNKIPLHVNRGKSGIVGDWSFAVSCATTDYLTLVDQDDLYFHDYSKTMIELLDSTPDSLIAFANYQEIDHSSRPRKTNLTMAVKRLLLWPFLFSHRLSGQFGKKWILRFGNPICSPSVTYNLKNLDPSSLFDESYAMSLDWDAWLHMCDKAGSFCYSRKTLLSHRIHQATQTSGGISDGKRYSEDLRIFSRLWPKWMARVLAKAYAASYRSNV